MVTGVVVVAVPVLVVAVVEAVVIVFQLLLLLLLFCYSCCCNEIRQQIANAAFVCCCKLFMGKNSLRKLDRNNVLCVCVCVHRLPHNCCQLACNMLVYVSVCVRLC